MRELPNSIISMKLNYILQKFFKNLSKKFLHCMWAQVCFWHNLHLCIKEKSFLFGVDKKTVLPFIKKWWKNTTVYSNFYQQKFKFIVHSIDSRYRESSWQLNCHFFKTYIFLQIIILIVKNSQFQNYLIVYDITYRDWT